MNNRSEILIVDLDNTLIRSDLLFEACLQLLKRKPYLIFAYIYWLTHGKAHFKHQVAQRQPINADSLLYRKEVLDLIAESKKLGQQVWLATAASEIYANSIAKYLNLFDQVIASSESINLKGAQKLRAIQASAKGQSFSYVGDSYSDIKIWEHCKKIFVVCPSDDLMRKIKTLSIPFEILETKKGTIVPFLKAIRPQQWAKNSLLFVPLLSSHNIFDLGLVQLSILAFISYSLAASSAYVLNDVLDVEADRQHFRKKYRPFASGAISLPLGLLFSFLLLCGSFGFGFFVNKQFVLILITYLILTLSYSIYFKQKLLVDVIMLASLYTLRIFAGGQATQIHVSDWLLSFSLFFFFSLALLKRFSEVKLLPTEKSDAIKGRGYLSSDSLPLAMIGIASGFVALLILSLYFTSDAVTQLYASPRRLWLLMPLFVYWLSRIWILAGRGTIHDDPVVFAIKDTRSLFTGFLIFSVLFFALF